MERLNALLDGMGIEPADVRFLATVAAELNRRRDAFGATTEDFEVYACEVEGVDLEDDLRASGLTP